MIDSELLFQLSLASCRALAWVAAAAAGTLLATKAARAMWLRYAGRRETKFLAPLIAHLSSSSDRPASELAAQRPFDRLILQRLLLSMSHHLDREDLRRVCALYERLGFAAREVGRLRSSLRWWIRARAAQRLGQMRAASGKAALRRALSDPHTEVRLMAAWALGQLQDLDSLEPIFRSLAGFSKIAALRVSAIVLSFGQHAVAALLPLLATPDPVVQVLAMRLLGELKDRRATRSLLPFLQHEDKEIRIAACEALGRLADPDAAPALRRALADPEWAVTAKAAQAAGLLGDEQAIGLLVEALGHRQWWVRLHAGEALARLGERGRRALEEAWRQHPDPFARDMAAQWLDELAATT